MNLILCKNYDEMSQKAAELIAKQINEKPNSVLGLATGSTPIGTYSRLIEMNKNNAIDFKNVVTFNLDEYYPISHSNSQSYHSFMNENLFKYINIDLNNTHIPNGETVEPTTECAEYEKQIEAFGGVDLQILGIGRNGHIGFNEPSNHFTKGSFKVKLTESTIEANSKYFDENPMPHYALTMGVGSIMSAKKIILIATGKAKADAVKALVDGEVSPACPASILQFHRDTVIYLDKDAASLL